VLDLFSEGRSVWDTTDQYFGHQWVWNLLHDYGQNQGLYGALDYYASEPLRARQEAPATLVGVGLTMEGMNQNEVVRSVAWVPMCSDMPARYMNSC
jgi:alpha-N-acetylglucosaminidase